MQDPVAGGMQRDGGSPMSAGQHRQHPDIAIAGCAAQNATKAHAVMEGECVTMMAQMEEDSVDMICTDPPYGLGMGEWDGSARHDGAWQQCLRVLRPGGMAMVMSAPRADLMSGIIRGLSDAGFDVSFTPIFWAYASGFAKGRNIGRSLEEEHPMYARLSGAYAGYQPKPAVEVIIVAMSPIDGPYTGHALDHGNGVTWLDDVRIPVTDSAGGGPGRMPANLVSTDDALNDGTIHRSGVISESHRITPKRTSTGWSERYGRRTASDMITHGDAGSFSRFFDADAWAAQFLVTSKPGPAERGMGVKPSRLPLAEFCEAERATVYGNDGSSRAPNDHQTVKPITLAAYLVTMGSRRGDTVLDPFAGSGTTAIAAGLLGRHSISIERDHHNCCILHGRLRYWAGKSYSRMEAVRRRDTGRQREMTDWFDPA